MPALRSRLVPTRQLQSRLRDISLRPEFAAWTAFTQGTPEMNRSSATHLALMIPLVACAHLPSQPRGRPNYWGFTGPWDTCSDASVQAHGRSLDRIISGSISLDTTSFGPVRLYSDGV